MFPILQEPINTDFPLITKLYETLHFDGIPILFTGLNRFENRIMASSVEEDFDSKIERFFYVITSEEDYKNFIAQQISYLRIMQKSKSIYLIDRAFDNSFKTTYLLSIEDIPQDYLPLEDSFCPDEVSIISHWAEKFTKTKDIESVKKAQSSLRKKHGFFNFSKPTLQVA